MVTASEKKSSKQSGSTHSGLYIGFPDKRTLCKVPVTPYVISCLGSYEKDGVDFKSMKGGKKERFMRELLVDSGYVAKDATYTQRTHTFFIQNQALIELSKEQYKQDEFDFTAWIAGDLKIAPKKTKQKKAAAPKKTTPAPSEPRQKEKKVSGVKRKAEEVDVHVDADADADAEKPTQHTKKKKKLNAEPKQPSTTSKSQTTSTKSQPQDQKKSIWKRLADVNSVQNSNTFYQVYDRIFSEKVTDEEWTEVYNSNELVKGACLGFQRARTFFEEVADMEIE